MSMLRGSDWSLLAESYRGQCGDELCVETSHFGAFAVVNSEDDFIFSAGNVYCMAHLRSTAKPFQLLPFILDHLDEQIFENGQTIDSADIALLMSSHYGEAIHTNRIERLLALAQLSKTDLLCGIHPPFDDTTRKTLLAAQKPVDVVHNNCSGKHTAMLMSCQKNKWALGSYLEEGHPLQQKIIQLLLLIANAKYSQLGVGVDGCNVPTFILPLKNIAHAYAELAFPSKRFSCHSELSQALNKLFVIGSLNPEMIGGRKSFDTALMQALPQQIFVKSGAEGILTMAIAPRDKYPRGLGVAIKIADGDFSKKVRPLVAISILQKLEILPLKLKELPETLKTWTSYPIRSVNEQKAGKFSIFL
jgi:L-asparaginase II